MKLHYCFSENALQGTPWAKIWLGSIVHGLTWANIMVHKVVHGWSWACSFLRILSVLHPASQYFDDIHPDVEEVQTHHFIVVADDNISSLFCIDDLASEITNYYQADCPTYTCTAIRPYAYFVSIWYIYVDEEWNLLRWLALSLAVKFMTAFPTSIKCALSDFCTLRISPLPLCCWKVCLLDTSISTFSSYGELVNGYVRRRQRWHWTR